MVARNQWAGGTPNNDGFPQRQGPMSPGYPLNYDLPTQRGGGYNPSPGVGGGFVPPAPEHIEATNVYAVEEADYCNHVVVNTVALNGVDSIALYKPDGRRVYLLIYNTGGSTVWVNYGTTAGVGIGLPIGSGGSLELFKRIDQQDIHLFADGADSTVVIQYANKKDFQT